MDGDLQPFYNISMFVFLVARVQTCSNPVFSLLWMLIINRPRPSMLFSVAMIEGRQDHLVASKRLLPSFSLEIRPFQAISESD
jgi:hypothetical protein